MTDLDQLVPSIIVYIMQIMKDSRDMIKSHRLTLSIELVATILLYTHDDPRNTGCKFYKTLNAALRSRQRDNVKPYFGYLRMLIEALSHMEVFVGAVYRGIAGIDLSDAFPIEKRVRVWELMSVSKLKSVAEGFASYGSKPQHTVLVIETRGVRVLGHLSKYPTEQECLFLPGSAFIATRVVKEGHRTVIYLQHQEEDIEVLYR